MKHHHQFTAALQALFLTHAYVGTTSWLPYLVTILLESTGRLAGGRSRRCAGGFATAARAERREASRLTSPAHPFCSMRVRLFEGVVTNAADLPEMIMFPGVCAVLLLASVTDHGQIRDRHMTVLGGVFIHAVLFHFSLHVFFHPVLGGIRYYADNLDRMADMFAEFDGVALDLPGAAALRGKVVLIGILAFLKTAGERPRFLVGGFCCVRSQSGRARKHEQRNNPRHDLEIHH